MKKHLLITLLGLNLAACKKTDVTDETTAPIATTFDQAFDLHYQQSASLPAFANPELTIKVTDFQYAICPKNVICFAVNFVAPSLSIADAQGRTQQVSMGIPVPTSTPRNLAWVDTTSIAANGRRYLLCYTKWSVIGDNENPSKKDLVVTLRVTKF